VTSAANSPERQPSTPRRSPPSRDAAWSGLGAPIFVVAPNGTGSTCSSPCLADRSWSYSRIVVGWPIVAARSAIMSGSPMTTIRLDHGDSAIARQSSGPIPAGSPAVTASRSDSRFDKGFVTDSSDPELGFVIELSVPDTLDAIAFLEVFRVVVDTTLEYFKNVPAKSTAERFG